MKVCFDHFVSFPTPIPEVFVEGLVLPLTLVDGEISILFMIPYLGIEAMTIAIFVDGH